ncbi:MAG: TatD family hydrolase [Clostridiales bacterium]|mgnify:FL=1|nr:TatD family hydrolase [Clostridiales bacterium]
MYFDTHAHYNDEAFDADRSQVLSEIRDSGVSLVVNAGNDLETSLAAMRLAEKHDFIYAAVGWHPQDADSFDAESPELIRKWLKNPKVRAIGEIGLDYYYDNPERDVQRRVLYRQMELARELNVPVVIHDREAHADCLEIVRRFPEVCGEFHCYSGSAEMAKKLIDMGWYLGFTGVVTFKNARRVIEVVEICPVDRMLIETDCPYLAPVPVRGKRNDSRYLRHIAEKIAEIKGMAPEEIARITLNNGRRFFRV